MLSQCQRGYPKLRLTAIASCMLALYGTAGMHVLHAESISSSSAMQTSSRNHNPHDRQPRSPATRQNHRGPMAAVRTTPARLATSINVANCNDDGPGSLRQSLLDAAGGDTIDLTELTCSTITLTSGPLYSSVTMTILGPGRDQLTIDGNANGLVLDHSGGQLEIEGITITNGRTNDGFGGCIHASSYVRVIDSRVTGCIAGNGANDHAYGAALAVFGDVQVNNSIVSGNTAQATTTVRGGGIYSTGEARIKYGSTVSGNMAVSLDGDARGGGVFAVGGAYVRDQVVIANNRVESTHGTAAGGGICAGVDSSHVSYSTISGNTAHSTDKGAYGGGIQQGNCSTPGSSFLSVSHSTVSHNTASSDCDDCLVQGGGANVIGKISMAYSTVHHNAVISASATSGRARGGGIATDLPGYAGQISFLESTISGNSALGGSVGSGAGHGGGVATPQAYVDILNSTIAFNTASTSGGGIFVFSEDDGAPMPSYLTSSIVSNNQAPSAPDLAVSADSPPPLDVVGDHNLVMNVGGNVNLPGDTIQADPVLLQLTNNGGTTATHALSACSPAIDSGSNPNSLDFDQRSPLFAREWGAATDIGAFELQPYAERIFIDGFEGLPCP